MEDLADSLMEAIMMIRRTRMRSKVVVRTKGVISPIRTTKIIEEEEEEESKDMEEEVSVENVSIATKKGINHLNILSAKEAMIEEMNGRVEMQLLMKM